MSSVDWVHVWWVGVFPIGLVLWGLSVLAALVFLSDCSDAHDYSNSRQTGARVVLAAMFVVPILFLLWPLTVAGLISFVLYMLARGMHGLIKLAMPDEVKQ